MISPIEWSTSEGQPKVLMLDQTRLPSEVIWIDCKDSHMVARGIRELWIRGAPAIGIAAAMGIALGAQQIKTDDTAVFLKELSEIIQELRSTRPTAVNLFWAINRMQDAIESGEDLSTEQIKAKLIDEALFIQKDEIKRNQAIGEHGATLIKRGDNLLTHCNTGALATGGHGTALGVIRTAWSQGKGLHVWVDETRPILQGSRLTMWELENDKIPCTLITDSMAGAIMKTQSVQTCIVGADRIAGNGDTANKIGTYSIAVLAKAHGIPFYIAAPSSTVDLSIESGDQIPIEERPPDEVTTIMGKLRIAPEKVTAANPAFDVTPAELITGIITEIGVLKPEELKKRLTAS